PLPERPIDQPFLMPIEDVFSISGGGPVGTRRIERGKIKAGEEGETVGLRETQKPVVRGVEIFRRLLAQGVPGGSGGRLLRGAAWWAGPRRRRWSAGRSGASGGG